ncbi:chemotaxis protein CheB [uncultured Friedmanniella sp.]|uniref:chemotaxis protein CheB n=1 Tax=uncultured Friedmanniella sp. TaxID=335381 RepID=UPI0035C98BB4
MSTSSQPTTPPTSPVPLLAIGGSAGSLGPLTELVNGLPADLDAAVLVCQHTGQDGRSHLPDILARRSQLPASWAVDEERLERGHVYVAPPGRHLLVNDGFARVSAGARVNRHRPSVDVLFASAAQSAGPATIAVVLSGVLDDGAVGAALVDLVGGTVWVQDPDAAEFGSMPGAALAAAPGARIMSSVPSSRDIVAALRRSSAARASDVRPATTEVEVEVGMDGAFPNEPGFLRSGETKLTRLACPECGGGLAQVDLPQISYFRCHVGHQYGPQSLAAAQSDATEQKLWAALAALEEQAVVQGYLEGTEVLVTSEPPRPGTFRSSASELADRAVALREQVQKWTLAAHPDDAAATT